MPQEHIRAKVVAAPKARPFPSNLRNLFTKSSEMQPVVDDKSWKKNHPKCSSHITEGIRGARVMPRERRCPLAITGADEGGRLRFRCGRTRQLSRFWQKAHAFRLPASRSPHRPNKKTATAKQSDCLTRRIVFEVESEIGG